MSASVWADTEWAAFCLATAARLRTAEGLTEEQCPVMIGVDDSVRHRSPPVAGRQPVSLLFVYGKNRPGSIEPGITGGGIAHDHPYDRLIPIRVEVWAVTGGMAEHVWGQLLRHGRAEAGDPQYFEPDSEYPAGSNAAGEAGAKIVGAWVVRLEVRGTKATAHKPTGYDYGLYAVPALGEPGEIGPDVSTPVAP